MKEAGNDRKRGLKYILGNGRKINFWRDVWVGECPLNILFPHLFEICNQQNQTVKQILGGGEVDLTFRRNFGVIELEEWELLEKVDVTILSTEKFGVLGLGKIRRLHDSFVIQRAYLPWGHK